MIKDLEKCQFWACFSTSAKLGTELQQWTEWTVLTAPFTHFAVANQGNHPSHGKNYQYISANKIILEKDNGPHVKIFATI